LFVEINKSILLLAAALIATSIVLKLSDSTTLRERSLEGANFFFKESKYGCCAKNISACLILNTSD